MGTGAVLFLAMIIGAPIGICLCLAAIVFLYTTDNTVLFSSYPAQMFDSVGNYGLSLCKNSPHWERAVLRTGRSTSRARPKKMKALLPSQARIAAIKFRMPIKATIRLML